MKFADLGESRLMQLFGTLKGKTAATRNRIHARAEHPFISDLEASSRFYAKRLESKRAQHWRTCQTGGD